MSTQRQRHRHPGVWGYTETTTESLIAGSSTFALQGVLHAF
jgi:hypothetical protein